MRYEFLYVTDEGLNVFARIDEDGLCRVTCTEENPDYKEWLNLQAEHFTPNLS
jgi:hypothetical protein